MNGQLPCQPAPAGAPAAPAAPPRPEDAGRASAYYDAAEAARYSGCGEVERKQLELSLRALDLLRRRGGLPGRSCWPPLLADAGCGSGLSGAVLGGAGLPWLGLDVAPHMLQVRAARRSVPWRGGAPTPDACTP